MVRSLGTTSRLSKTASTLTVCSPSTPWSIHFPSSTRNRPSLTWEISSLRNLSMWTSHWRCASPPRMTSFSQLARALMTRCGSGLSCIDPTSRIPHSGREFLRASRPSCKNSRGRDLTGPRLLIKPTSKSTGCTLGLPRNSLKSADRWTQMASFWMTSLVKCLNHD